MHIIIGLGNPGIKYRKTRHNAGFLVLDNFSKDQGFPKFRRAKKFQADISQKNEVMLVKPQTYMNASGKALKQIFNLAYRQTGFQSCLSADRFSIFNQFSNNLIVVHDDLDIPLGEIKISKNKSAGGHKGVQSIINELGTQNFKRVRVGIEHEAWNMKHETFVLEKFSKEEWKILGPAIKKAGQALLELLAQK